MNKQKDYTRIGIAVVVVLGSALVFSLFGYIINYVIGFTIELSPLIRNVISTIFGAIGGSIGMTIYKRIKQQEERLDKLEREIEKLKKNNL